MHQTRNSDFYFKISITLLTLYIHLNRGGNGTPLQYSCLENPIDGGAWWDPVHGVAKSRARLSDFTFTFHFHALEKEMATHSSVLAWRIPGREEPSGLLSVGSHRVRHDWSDLAAAAAAGVLLTLLQWSHQTKALQDLEFYLIATIHPLLIFPFSAFPEIN